MNHFSKPFLKSSLSANDNFRVAFAAFSNQVNITDFGFSFEPDFIGGEVNYRHGLNKWVVEYCLGPLCQNMYRICTLCNETD